MVESPLISYPELGYPYLYCVANWELAASDHRFGWADISFEHGDPEFTLSPDSNEFAGYIYPDISEHRLESLDPRDNWFFGTAIDEFEDVRYGKWSFICDIKLAEFRWCVIESIDHWLEAHCAD